MAHREGKARNCRECCSKRHEITGLTDRFAGSGLQLKQMSFLELPCSVWSADWSPEPDADNATKAGMDETERHTLARYGPHTSHWHTNKVRVVGFWNC